MSSEWDLLPGALYYHVHYLDSSIAWDRACIYECDTKYDEYILFEDDGRLCTSFDADELIHNLIAGECIVPWIGIVDAKLALHKAIEEYKEYRDGVHNHILSILEKNVSSITLGYLLN